MIESLKRVGDNGDDGDDGSGSSDKVEDKEI